MWLDFAGSSRRTSTPRRAARDQAVHEALVGDEVGVRHPDVALGPVDRLEVHAPDGEHPQPGHVAVHPDPRLPGRRGRHQHRRLAAPEPLLAVQVPEVGERAGQVPHSRAGDPAVRVAPLRGVGRADVVAADEADLVVDDEDLAVVTAVAAEVEEAPPGRVDRVGEHLHVRREVLERRPHHDVGERVVDDPDLDAAVGRVDERLLEPLADGVALPDVGLEQDLLLRPLDGGEHVVVQVLAEGVRRHGARADRRLLGRARGERLRLLAPAPVGVDQAHPDRDQHRDAEDRQQGALRHLGHRVLHVDEGVVRRCTRSSKQRAPGG